MFDGSTCTQVVLVYYKQISPMLFSLAIAFETQAKDSPHYDEASAAAQVQGGKVAHKRYMQTNSTKQTNSTARNEQHRIIMLLQHDLQFCPDRKNSTILQTTRPSRRKVKCSVQLTTTRYMQTNSTKQTNTETNNTG